MKVLPARLRSIDIFRALTMLLMIFVNDTDSVQHIPSWIEHVEGDVDGMGFADTIFPAFLFISGLSLPFAIRNRLNKGASLIQISGYILLRVTALLVMGFFHVNMEEYNGEGALLSRPVWSIFVTVSFFLIWLDYPATAKKTVKYSCITAGIALLATMALLYKGGSEEMPADMQTHWWGILGMIGWAYLVCAPAYLLVRDRLLLLSALLLFLFGINLLNHAGLLEWYPPVIGDGSSATLMMAGIVVSVAYTRLSALGSWKPLWLVLLNSSIVLPVLGLLVRPYAGGISKINATPAWVLICTGISLLVFTGAIWLADKKGKYHLFDIIRPAGSSTLTCYLLPYLLNPLLWLLHIHYPQWLSEGIPGILRSFAFAFVVIWLAGKMEKKHIRLQI